MGATRQRHINMKHQLLILSIVLGIMESLRLVLYAKNGDCLNADTSVILKRTSHTELAVLVFEVDLRHSILHN